jgi:hypothetical protein
MKPAAKGIYDELVRESENFLPADFYGTGAIYICQLS